MSGMHAIRRDTVSFNDFNLVQSTLKLPTSAKARENDPGTYFNGCYPEFIHGYHGANYTYMDLGIIYKENKFHFFAYSGKAIPNVWAEQPISLSGIKLGATIIFTTEIKNGFASINLSVGGLSTGVSWRLTDNGQKAYLNGAKIVREMVLALNKDTDGSFKIPTGAYFKGAYFTNTRLDSKQHGLVDMGRITTVATKETYDDNLSGGYVDAVLGSNGYSLTDTVNEAKL